MADKTQRTDLAAGWYAETARMPIYDYHCHLSPREIFEDRQFGSLGEMWLCADHYKWRLMRACGVDEALITGSASWSDKLAAYIGALQYSAGNPLYTWSVMELEKYFGVTLPLLPENAAEIERLAGEAIQSRQLSPRKLIEQSNVRYIATTDDICDTLEYHRLLAAEPNLSFRVAPSFRTDNALLATQPGYPEYIAKLASASGVLIADLDGFKAALINRLDLFVALGCKFTDVGIEHFPDRVGSEAQASAAFKAALNGQALTHDEYHAFLGYMYMFLAGEYQKRGLVMQLHTGVKRNTNAALFASIGRDCGCDTIGDPVPVSDVARLLDLLNSNGMLPRTIIYTLDPSQYYPLAVLAGAFRGVTLGAAWWFCDHRRGIGDQLRVYSATGSLGGFTGMLTDSRSFLSYARHDYFRAILCGHVAECAAAHELDPSSAPELIRRVCWRNIAEVIG